MGEGGSSHQLGGAGGTAVPGTERRHLEPDCWKVGREHRDRHWRQKQDVLLLRDKSFTGAIHPSALTGARLVLGLTSLTWSKPSEKEGP